jgi:hypothetical protein
MITLAQAIAAFNPKNADENTIQDQFWSIAEVALYGGYFLVNKEVHIYPVEIEFYLYVEDAPKGSWQQDANMYHKGKDVPYFPKEGSLYPHRSGVDYTFENEKQKYRASFLIRSYRYEAHSEVVENPTYLWEDLFGYNSIDGKGLTISWVDAPEDVKPVRKQGTRINLKDGNGNVDEKPWRFIKRVISRP